MYSLLCRVSLLRPVRGSLAPRFRAGCLPAVLGRLPAVRTCLLKFKGVLSSVAFLRPVMALFIASESYSDKILPIFLHISEKSSTFAANFEITVDSVKRFFNILWQIVTWIGAIYIEFLVALYLCLFVAFFVGSFEVTGFWESILLVICFLIIVFLFIAGIYICVVAFRYAYLRNRGAEPLRLECRRKVSMLTLLLSILPMALVGLSYIVDCLPLCKQNACMEIWPLMNIFLMLCAWIAVPTLCIYVFILSRPDRYEKKFLNQEQIS